MAADRLRRDARRMAEASFTALPPKVRAQVVRVNRLRPGNRVQWGNLHRTRPFGVFSGYDRGVPVDRPLIEAFLDRHRGLVRGRVLEIKSPDYTRTYGGAAVTEEVVVDIDATNKLATVVADLCVPGSLGTTRVDCVILTQTLQFLTDPAASLTNVWDALEPGGALLVTVPHVSAVDHWLDEADLWRFTPHGLELLCRRSCPGAEITIEPLGNVLIAAAYLYGLAVEELEPSAYDDTDPRIPITVGAVVRRPAS